VISGIRGEAQQDGDCLPKLNQLLFMGERGLEGCALSKEKRMVQMKPYFKLQF